MHRGGVLIFFHPVELLHSCVCSSVCGHAGRGRPIASNHQICLRGAVWIALAQLRNPHCVHRAPVHSGYRKVYLLDRHIGARRRGPVGRGFFRDVRTTNGGHYEDAESEVRRSV